MKKRQRNTCWYNPCDREIGGIVWEGREAVARFRGPWPDARMGLRLMGVRLNLEDTIL